MHLLTLIAIVVGLVLLTSFLGKSGTIKGKSEDAKLPYAKKPYLMTNAEREFFKVLHLAVQDKYYIVPQVQLSKIVQVVGEGKWHYQYKNKINLKSVDFVLFDKEYFTPQIIIELDDLSHLRPDRQERDTFVDRIMKNAGLNLIHIRQNSRYTLEEVKNWLKLI